MTGTATRTDTYVGFYGDGTTHWRVEPPLDGHDYILICDRTQLASVPAIKGEPDWAALGVVIETRIPHAVEVFASDENGGIAGGFMTSLRDLISLRRHHEGIDLTEILSRLGYEEGGTHA